MPGQRDGPKRRICRLLIADDGDRIACRERLLKGAIQLAVEFLDPAKILKRALI